MGYTSACLLATSLIFIGCSSSKITPIENRYSAEMHRSLFPFGEGYTRLDDIEGRWTQVGWDVFPQKTPWIEPAEVLVAGGTVTFIVTPWTRNSATVEDNERELLSHFYEFDYQNHPRKMFRRNNAGRILLTVNRADIYIQGANKQGVDFLGIGFFDPPMVLQRRK